MASPDGSGRYVSPALSITAPLRFNGSDLNIDVFGFGLTLRFEKLPPAFPNRDSFVANGTTYKKIDCTAFPASDD